MVYPSLKKMGRAKASGEGNYASSNCPHREDDTKLELGLTLLPGSQIQKGGSNIFKRAALKGNQTHGQDDVNQQQEDWSPIGHSHEARSSRFTPSSFALQSQRGSRILESPAVAHQYDEKIEVGNRGALFRQSTLTTHASDRNINIMSRRRLDGPSVSTRFENDDHTIEIKDKNHDGNGGTRNHPYLRRSRRMGRVERRCHINQNFGTGSCNNRTSQTRKVSSHSNIFEALNHLNICKAVPFNVVDVPSLHISAVHSPRPRHDIGEKLRLCALSTGSENETIDIGKIGQKDAIKTRSQPRRDRGERCAKALEWNNVDGGEGSVVELDGGSDSLKLSSASALRICETYHMADNFDESLVPEPDTVQLDGLTRSTETVSDVIEVSASIRGSEKADPVLAGRHGHCGGDGAKFASKRVSPKQPEEAFGRCSSGASPHQNLKKDQKRLVPGSKRDENCVDGEFPLVYSTHSSSSSYSTHSYSTHSSSPSYSAPSFSTSSLSPSPSPSSLSHTPSSSSFRHPIFTAPTAPFKLNLQRQASILTASASTSHGFAVPNILCASRKRSTSLPGLRFVKSSAAMDYHQTAQSNVQYYQDMFSEIPDFSILSSGQSGRLISAPPRNFDASLNQVWQQQLPDLTRGSNEWNSPSSSLQQKHADRLSQDLHNINNAIYARSHHEDLTARVSHFVSTFPLDGAAHQNIPMDVAYARIVNEVIRLHARVQELQSDNGGLTENIKRCNRDRNQMRSRFAACATEASKRLQSKAKEIEDQKAETQIWKRKFEQLYTVSQQNGPKRSSAVTVFETVGRFTPETSFIPQSVLPVLKPVVVGATETNSDIEFTTTDARIFSVSPESLTLAPEAAIQTRAAADTTSPSAATPIDLTVDESPDINPILPASSVSPPSDPSSTAQDVDPVQELSSRVRQGALWMNEAHPFLRVQNPAAQMPDRVYPRKRIRLLDTAMSAQSASAATAEATKTEAEKNKAKAETNHARAPAKPVEPSKLAAQRKKDQEQRKKDQEQRKKDQEQRKKEQKQRKKEQEQQKKEQEQRKAEQARASDLEAKLRDDHKRRQDMAVMEKEKEEVESQAPNQEEQLSSPRAQEGSLETPFSDVDSLASLFEDDEDRADGEPMDWEGQEDHDGLGAELDAAMAKEAEREESK